MNLIDSVLMQLAPSRAAKRIRDRIRAQALMNYDAAKPGRRTDAWRAPRSSADGAAINSRETLRNLSRDFVRNRPWAARVRDVVTVNVVASGIRPSVECKDPEVKEAVERVIRSFLLSTAIDARRRQSLFQMQATAMNAVFADGEVLVRQRMRNRNFEKDLALPFQVELIEVDHLDMAKTSHGNNEVIEGLEYGPTGRVEAYHLFRHHPAEIAFWRKGARVESERVPAAQILHLYRQDRPGQMRGVPWLAPVMLTLGEISDYQEAQILKQKMAALMAGVVTTDAEGATFRGAGLEELHPGALVGLEPGQKIEWTNPPQVEAYDEFMRAALGAVAMGVGITYEALSGDLRQVNFSSGRMGRMEMDRLVEQWQHLILIAQFCEGIARWFKDSWALQAGRRENDIPAGEFEIRWTAPRRPLIDPVKEIGAMVAEVEGGLSSTQRQQRRLGYDPEEIDQERADDAARGRGGVVRPTAAAPTDDDDETDNGGPRNERD
ncbi:phage portal protein [Roseibacterium beibuensis]|uniref:Phage portal protein n=1 Tax=[Roseibacterium] beibuensis TaxID=1193142 RepID=A0ABP9L966_9RHOB|nr:phage portal protein [Roseibacterium beibuensis]MCS6624347.1 phage portal protein [Roseibacterium beibuensis]